jgi:hypothetical protein
MKISNKELLKIAEDESTDSSCLKEIWYTSRSIKVRKAVASNPNCGADVLRVAARLYLEEVLLNPGFEMLKLFDSDPWIKTIGGVYDNPEKYLLQNRNYVYRSQDADQLSRAALLSPKCTAESTALAFDFLPVSSIKRVISSEKTKLRLRSILSEAYDSKIIYLSMEGVFKAWDAGLINTRELGSYIRLRGGATSQSCRKGVYVKTFRKLSKEYLEEKTDDSLRAIAIIFLFSRGSCLRWIEYDLIEDHLPVIAEALTAAINLEKRDLSNSKRTCPNIKSSLKNISGLFTSIAWHCVPYADRKDNLGRFFYLANKHNLSHYQWGNFKKCWPAIRFESDFCKELEELPIAAQAFYARAGCMGDWVHLGANNARLRIVENVNEWLYKKGGVENLLYNQISLKKIIALTDNVLIP